MTVSWVGWTLFNGFVLLMLALDLGVFHRKAHAVRPREALVWTTVWISLALLFNVFVYYRAGQQIALEFLTGYVLEKSLSVDNIFVIVMIFSFFRVPAAYQHRVLFWGVLGALVLRGIFIALGAYVLHRWEWVMYIFGALLVVTGIKMAVRQEEVADLTDNAILKFVRRLVPITPAYHGQRFFIREGGRILGTPLLLVIVLVELSDLMFAIDSIPAIFAITNDTFVVYTSNIFAILGLRSMFFLLAAVVERFVYLKYGLAVVLTFIGVKMLLHDVYKVPVLASLGIITALIGGSIAFSLLHPPKEVPVVPGHTEGVRDDAA